MNHLIYFFGEHLKRGLRDFPLLFKQKNRSWDSFILFFLLSLCRINSQADQEEQEEEDGGQKKKGRGKKDVDDLDSDDEDFDLSDHGDDDDDEGEDLHNDLEQKKTQSDKSDALPDVSRVSFKDWRQWEGFCTKWTF